MILDITELSVLMVYGPFLNSVAPKGTRDAVVQAFFQQETE
ncbi:MAG: hypothetical protein ACU88J_12760 [Gammaproteobacteria bacterium]